MPEDFSPYWSHGLDFSGQADFTEDGLTPSPPADLDRLSAPPPATPMQQAAPAAAGSSRTAGPSSALAALANRDDSNASIATGLNRQSTDIDKRAPGNQPTLDEAQDFQGAVGALLVTSAGDEDSRYSDPNIIDTSTKGPVRASTIMLNPRVSSVLCPAGPPVCPVEFPKGFFDHSIAVHGKGQRSDGRSYFDPRLATKDQLERLAFDTLRNGVAHSNPLMPGEYWITATFPFPVGYIKSFDLGGILTRSPAVRYVRTNKATLKVYGVPSPIRGAPQIPFKGATIYPDH